MYDFMHCARSAIGDGIIGNIKPKHFWFTEDCIVTWTMVGNTKLEAWGFWNWDVKEKSAFGDEDEEADGSTPFKATKQATPL